MRILKHFDQHMYKLSEFRGMIQKNLSDRRMIFVKRFERRLDKVKTIRKLTIGDEQNSTCAF